MFSKNILPWVPRVIAAVILLQTLYFKFTGAPEAIKIFTALGVEPWGRITLGIIELITALLILIPTTSTIGALIGIGLMIGAIVIHITVLGISSSGDGGLLFGLAWVVLICSIFIVYKDHLELIQYIK